eukprot:scaffold17128_cov185-Isochrysis_galbana.AAC.1
MLCVCVWCECGWRVVAIDAFPSGLVTATPPPRHGPIAWCVAPVSPVVRPPSCRASRRLVSVCFHSQRCVASLGAVNSV